MEPVDSEIRLLDQATKTLKEVTKPNVFSVLIALIGLAGLAALVYQDQRRADAQVATMAALVLELQTQGAQIKEVHDWCCTVAPAPTRHAAIP